MDKAQLRAEWEEKTARITQLDARINEEIQNITSARNAKDSYKHFEKPLKWASEELSNASLLARKIYNGERINANPEKKADEALDLILGLHKLPQVQADPFLAQLFSIDEINKRLDEIMEKPIYGTLPDKGFVGFIKKIVTKYTEEDLTKADDLVNEARMIFGDLMATLSEQAKNTEKKEREAETNLRNYQTERSRLADERDQKRNEYITLAENERTEANTLLEQRIQELETQNGELEIRAGTPTRLPGIKPLSEKQKPKNDDKKSEPQKDGKSEKSPARKAAEYTMFGTMGLAAFGGLFLSAMTYFKDSTPSADYQADSQLRREAYFFQKAGQSGITDLSKIENEGNYQIVVAKEHINSANDFTVFVANEAITPLNDLILDAQHNDSKNNRLSYNSGKNSLPDRTAYEGKEAQTIIETIRNLDKNPNQISFEDVKLARQKMGKDGGINELIK